MLKRLFWINHCLCDAFLLFLIFRSKFELMAKRCIQKILERIVISLCVILCMQLPFFIIQYTHQLRGHIDELHWQLEQMEKFASLSGKTVDEHISKFMNNSDRDFANHGMMMRTIVHRYEKLSLAWTELRNSSALTRPFVFLRHVQWDIFSSTLDEFKMGISFTLESIIFGFIGILIGSGLCPLISLLFNRKKEIATRQIIHSSSSNS